MGIWSNRVDRSEIKPGDHIYSYRAAFTYSHHGICCSSSNIPSFCPSIHNIPHCGIRLPGSGVVLSCFDCFLRNGSLYRYGYGVSSFYFLSRARGGTCTTAKSDSSKMVLQRAMYLLLTGFGKFDALSNNCEDFSLYCKTGLVILQAGAGTSGQASSVAAGASLSASAIVFKLLMAASVGSIAAGTVGMYHLSRYGNDLGVRSGVIKVEVEALLPRKMMF